VVKSILKSYRAIKKLPDFIFIILACFMRFYKTCFMRFEMVDPYGCIDDKNMPFIILIWHNRLLLYPMVFKRKHRIKTYAMISPSRDGQYIADFVKQFGVPSIRGSSKKRAAGVLTEALNLISNGNNVSISPDGPGGPKYKLNIGPIILASMTGRPVIPSSINASKYWQLKTWDNFQIPKPFCKLQLVIGDQIKILPNLSDDEMEKWREYVEGKLNEISIYKDY